MKTWLITGASRGFGAVIAAHALARGDQVVATARDPQNVRDRFGQRDDLLALALDVTDDAAIAAAVTDAIARFGKIDVLVNNAGFGLIAAIEEASSAEIERLYRTNVFGLIAVTRAVLPHMRKARSGRILNMSSMGGHRGSAGFGIYASTKFAVEGLSEALNAEVSPLGIHVTAIEPGYFRTDFLDGSSLTLGAGRIEDYEATVGKVRALAAQRNHNQPGDPDKLAQVLMNLVETPDPPVRLPLGSDTVAVIEAKHAGDAKILEVWRSVSTSTDFSPAN